MLKLQPLFTTGAGLLLLLPQAALDDADLSSLASVLHETERALEVLRGVEARLQAGDGAAARLLLDLTEPPAFAGPAQDQELERLRAEVGLLQAELDVVDAYGAGAAVPRRTAAEPDARAASADPAARSASPAAVSEPAPDASGVRTGLSPDLLAALRSGPIAPGAQTAPTTPGPAEAETVRAPAASPEGAGYSADPIGHAKACLLAGRVEEGLALVASRPEPEAVALRARFLERLGRLDEAIAALEGVVGQLSDGYESRRAASDLEFLRWKRDFLARLPEDAR